MVSMMGFVMLMGVVVNNAIVLVDCINRFRLEGIDMESAVIEAGAVRMRPVLMTAITTILWGCCRWPSASASARK